jgi:hypothetical protein
LKWGYLVNLLVNTFRVNIMGKTTFRRLLTAKNITSEDKCGCNPVKSRS